KITTFLKKYLFRILVVLLMLAALTFFFVDLAQRDELGEAFSHFLTANILYLVLALLLMLVSMIIKAYRFFILIKTSNPELKFLKFLLPFFLGYGFSTLGPLKSGEIASVEINKRSLSIPRSSSLAAIAFFRVFDLFVVLILFIIGLGTTIPGIVEEQYTIYLNIIFYISLAGTIILSILLFFPPVGRLFLRGVKAIVGKMSLKGLKWLNAVIDPALENYYTSLQYLYKQVFLAMLVVVTTLIRWFLEFLSFKLTIMAFGENITLLDAAAISSITLFVGILTFVPAGLGTGTLTTQYLLEQLSIAPAIAAASVIFQTIVGTGVTLSVAAISSFFVKEKEEKEKEEKLKQ
ncbi:MAG: flippase-like domain-containing protein, partial [Candidatus Heimdallarchaeota archaeon]|nr:flippase-like domain-containing protein [Candidatus Heimdallarchaeota archaeon]